MNAHRINEGRMPDISNGKQSDFFFMEEEDADKAVETIVELVKTKLPLQYEKEFHGKTFRDNEVTELFIIIGWTVLQTCLVCTMYRYGVIRTGQLAALTIGIMIVTVLSIICYMLYYRLEYVKGYYDGMIPLILTGIMMVIIDRSVS